MIPRTDKPMEGVVFDVQDHTRWTGTNGPVHMVIWLVRTSMGLKNPSDGCWDDKGRTMLWWALAWRRRSTSLLGHFGRDQPRENHPLQMRWLLLMDWTPPRASWTFSGECGSVLGSFGTCGSLQEPQRGQRFASWMLIFPKKGPTSPSEGPDVSLLAHNYDIFSI